jgi:putative PIG3 family NAD(P)H quinone oxidoreductase
MQSDMLAVDVLAPSETATPRVIHCPTPEPGPGEVLIEVAAAGVNRVDALQRRGRYTPPPGSSLILGVEVSGVVAANGPGAQRYRPGDRVCALLVGGGYAEFVAAPEAQVLPAPETLSFVEAAALPETVATNWAALYDQGRLSPGETVLIHGGASGIGTTAIMMTKGLGAGRVFVTAGTAEKCAACEALGADRAINYRSEDFVEVVRAETGGRGVDVVLDMVAGDYVARNLDVLAADGRLVMLGTMGGVLEATFRPVQVMFNRLTITGVSLRGQSLGRKARIMEQVEHKVWPLVRAGRLTPLIDAVFPLEEAAAAHRRLDAADHAGKIVLTVREPKS